MRSPSDKPAVTTFEPAKSQLNGLDNFRFGTWKFDLNRLEDPVGFTRGLLPKIQVFPFESRRLLLKDLVPSLTAYAPQYRKDSDRYIRLIVYKKGDNSRYGVFRSECDSRLNAENFIKEFRQNPDLLKGYNVGFQSPSVGHKWTQCGYAKISDGWISSYDSYGLARFIYSNTLSDAAWQHLREVARWLVTPPSKNAFEADLITFAPPLESLASGGPQILAILTSYSPPGYKPYEHPGFDPRLNDFPNTKPFETGVWYHPKWGSRIDGTEVNDLCLFIEKLVKALGDYIYFRVEEIPSWSYKCFFTNRFGWIRDHYSLVLEEERGDILAYLLKLKSRLTSRLTLDLKSRLHDLVGGYQHDQDTFYKLLTLVEKVKGPIQNVSPMVDFLAYPTQFFIKTMAAQTEYNASFLVLFLCISWGYAAFFFKKLIVIGAVGAFYLRYSGFLLWAVFFTFIVTFGKIAKFFFFSFVNLTTIKYLLWVLFFSVYYLCLWGVKSECSNGLLGQNKIPKWAHRHILDRSDRRRGFFIFILPILVNVVFGLPTFISVENQRPLAVVVLLYYIIYLGTLSLTYEGFLNEKNFTPPFIRYFPGFIKARVFFNKKIKTPDRVRPSFIDKFNLFSRYPLTPMIVHSFIDGVRPRFWLTVFSSLGKILFFIVLFLLVLLAINLEGVLGHPLLTESWAGWFTRYNCDVTRMLLND